MKEKIISILKKKKNFHTRNLKRVLSEEKAADEIMQLMADREAKIMVSLLKEMGKKRPHLEAFIALSVVGFSTEQIQKAIDKL